MSISFVLYWVPCPEMDNSCFKSTSGTEAVSADLQLCCSGLRAVGKNKSHDKSQYEAVEAVESNLMDCFGN